MKNSKTPYRSLLILSVCLISLLCLTTTAACTVGANTDSSVKENDAQTDALPELPITSGIRIGTPNQYSMQYSYCYVDQELDGVMLVFGLTDAGKLEMLLSYCAPFWSLPDDLARVKAAKTYKMSDDEAQSLLNVQEILNDLLVNAGGGLDSRYMKRDELIKAAEQVIASEEYRNLAEAVKPLMSCEKTDARSLMLAFSEEELKTICDDLRENAYGEWSLRLKWLDEMEFSMLLPTKTAKK